VSTVGTRWYTLMEAAPVLGVSVDTVRRRLKRGELESRQVHTQHGPTWEVCLGIASTESQGAAQASANGAQGYAGGAAEGDAGPGMVQLVALVDRLQRENRDLAGQVGYLQACVQMHEETIRTLTAPAELPTEAPGAPEPPEPTMATFAARLRPLPLRLLMVLAVVAVVVLLVWSQ
jgi:hypothetical protein